jgi:hypothetical protein
MWRPFPRNRYTLAGLWIATQPWWTVAQTEDTKAADFDPATFGKMLCDCIDDLAYGPTGTLTCRKT